MAPSPRGAPGEAEAEAPAPSTGGPRPKVEAEAPAPSTGSTRPKVDAEAAAPSGGDGRPETAERDTDAERMARGYARGRARDEAARAALVPLAEGERPLAVTVAAIAAAVLAGAEIVSFAFGYSPGDESRIVRSVLAVFLLSAMSFGMWRVRYWAVLGMQAMLALTIVLAAVGAVSATNLSAVILVIAIMVPAGTLFWFLVKSMARIQMPQRPGS